MEPDYRGPVAAAVATHAVPEELRHLLTVFTPVLIRVEKEKHSIYPLGVQLSCPALRRLVAWQHAFADRHEPDAPAALSQSP